MNIKLLLFCIYDICKHFRLLPCIVALVAGGGREEAASGEPHLHALAYTYARAQLLPRATLGRWLSACTHFVRQVCHATISMRIGEEAFIVVVKKLCHFSESKISKSLNRTTKTRKNMDVNRQPPRFFHHVNLERDLETLLGGSNVVALSETYPDPTYAPYI